MSIIRKKDLNDFIDGLATEIIKFDSNLSVVRFGSSIQGKLYNNVDVDILLLSRKSYFKGNYSERLVTLRDNLIKGSNVSSFEIKNRNLEKIVSNYISSNKHGNITFIPKFIFGPFKYHPLYDSKKKQVYLHFKGPITDNQFILFCKNFPFHSRSIIYNSIVLKGHFDKEFYNSYIKLRKQEYIALASSLKKRTQDSNDIDDISKCAKKLIMNFCVFKGESNFEGSSKYKELCSRFKVELKRGRNIDICYFKNCFLDIYNLLKL